MLPIALTRCRVQLRGNCRRHAGGRGDDVDVHSRHGARADRVDAAHGVGVFAHCGERTDRGRGGWPGRAGRGARHVRCARRGGRRCPDPDGRRVVAVGGERRGTGADGDRCGRGRRHAGRHDGRVGDSHRHAARSRAGARRVGSRNGICVDAGRGKRQEAGCSSWCRRRSGSCRGRPCPGSRALGAICGQCRRLARRDRWRRGLWRTNGRGSHRAAAGEGVCTVGLRNRGVVTGAAGQRAGDGKGVGLRLRAKADSQGSGGEQHGNGVSHRHVGQSFQGQAANFNFGP